MQALGCARCAVRSLLVYVVSLCISIASSKHSFLNNSVAFTPIFTPEDFVIVINTEATRLQLALASRPLRVGLRTFIAIDNATLAEELNRSGYLHNETYAYFPNRNFTGPERSKPGDTRWQAAPFMAHHHYGPTYKWMLLGDDDTLWFMLGVKRLLYGYDHELPYAISDHLGDHNTRGFFVPSPLAAVCSPCHWHDLLRAHHREDLLPHSSAVLTPQEAVGWDPRDVDGWGNDPSSRPGRGPRTRQRRAAANAHADVDVGLDRSAGYGGGYNGAGGANGAVQRQQQQPKQQQQHPAWGRKGQEPINATEALYKAYYSTSSGFDASDVGGGGAAADVAAAARRQQQQQPRLLPPPIPPPGCPCRPAEGCLHRARVCRGRGRGQELCGRSLVFKTSFRGNRSWCSYSWGHGGAGVVLSVALLRATAGGPVETCARAMQMHSCDMNLAMCFMNPGVGVGLGLEPGTGLSSAPTNPVLGAVGVGGDIGGGGNIGSGGSGGGGFMFTHPGNAALRGANWADPRFIVFDNPVYQRVLHEPVGFLEGRVVCGQAERVAAVEIVAAGLEAVASEGDAAAAMAEEGAAEGEVVEHGVEGTADAAAAAAVEAAAVVGRKGRQAARWQLLSTAADKGDGGDCSGICRYQTALGGGEGGRDGDGLVASGRVMPSWRAGKAVVMDGEMTWQWQQQQQEEKEEEDHLAASSVVAAPREARGSKGGGGGVGLAVSEALDVLQGARQGVWQAGRALLKAAQMHGTAGGRDGGGGKVAAARRGGTVKRRDGDVNDDGVICEWLVRHAVSLHMHGRSYASYGEAANAMGAVVRQHVLAVRRLREMQQQ